MATQTPLPIGSESGFATEQIEDYPYENSALGYRLHLPQDWRADIIRAQTATLTTEVLKPLGLFFGPPSASAQPYAQIQAIQLSKGITAANWLKHYALLSKKKMDTLVELSPLFADSLLTFTIGGLPFKGRAAARIDQDRLFLILAFASADVYDHFAETFGQIVASFDLAESDPTKPVEPSLPYQRLPGLAFNYPQSWQEHSIQDSPQGITIADFYNYDDQRQSNGIMRTKVVSKQLSVTPKELIGQTINDFGEAQLRIERKLEDRAIEIANPKFYNARFGVLDAVAEGKVGRMELLICLFEDHNNFYSITLLTPSRKALFYVWAINWRAYDLLLGSIA